jgi:hypothetical protein
MRMPPFIWTKTMTLSRSDFQPIVAWSTQRFAMTELEKKPSMRLGLQNSTQVPLAQGNDMVGALAPDRSDQPFGEAVLPRRACGDGLVSDAHGP